MNSLSFTSPGMLFSRLDIRRLLIPLIAELFLSYFIGMADSIMVASAGEAAVSAVSLIDSVSVLFIYIFSSLGTGGAVVSGQYLGRKDFERARLSSEQMFMLVVTVSVLITALMLAGGENLIDFLYPKVDADVRTDCIIYYNIVTYSVPCIAIFNGCAALFRTTGDSRTPMYISLLMNIINIVGNAVLIYVFHMGVAGVAYPTLISRIVAMLIMIFLLCRKSFILNIRGLVHYRPNFELLKNIVSIGVPAGIENGMFQFGKLVLMSLVATLPTAAITANAIGNSLGALHCVVGMAANNALGPVVSRCAGAGDFRQARWYISYFMKVVYIVQGIVNILLLIAIPLILKLYGVGPEAAHYAVIIMVIHGISTMLLWPLAFILNNAMRAAGDSRFGMIISIVSMWLCRVGAAYVLVRYTPLGLIGVWLAWDIDWLFRMAFFIPRFRGSVWQTKTVK